MSSSKIFNGTHHQQSSWQKHLGSSSQANAYIWPAQACTHNTADAKECGFKLHHEYKLKYLKWHVVGEVGHTAECV